MSKLLKMGARCQDKKGLAILLSLLKIVGGLSSFLNTTMFSVYQPSRKQIEF